jgi:Plasmid encoded RepA protein
MAAISEQLELLGLEETLRRADSEAATASERSRLRRRIEIAHEMLSELPTSEALSFLHSGLCQTCLPHSRPAKNHAVWKRSSGRFSLIVAPGVLDDVAARSRWPRQGAAAATEEDDSIYVGVPYGPKARLILIYLQTEGLKSRTVSLGPSMSAFLRSLGLAVTGGARGTIAAVREQALRIARCSFTMQWTGTDAAGNTATIVSDTRIVEGLELWRAAGEAGNGWNGAVELSPRFHEHLRQHAVPLDKRGIAHLAGNSLGLDLYALFAYRLPRLEREQHLRWAHLLAQLGAGEKATKELARRVREVMPDVHVAYPHARVEVTSTGLLLRPSKPAIPKTSVNGFRLIRPDA